VERSGVSGYGDELVNPERRGSAAGEAKNREFGGDS